MTPVSVPHPILSRYGTSQAANSAIARLLGGHLPWGTPGGVHIRDCYADAADVTLHYSYSGRHTFLPLRLFAPYFSTVRPEDLARLVFESLDDDRDMGRISFGLEREESVFLADHAIPSILDAKIAHAQRTRSASIRENCSSFIRSFVSCEKHCNVAGISVEFVIFNVSASM